MSAPDAAAARLLEERRNQELIVVCRQLGTMLNAGTDILRALSVVHDQISNQALRAAVDSARSDMTLGWTLALSLQRHPELFTPFFIDMVRQGEGEGMLGDVLLSLADYLEKHVRSAMATDFPAAAAASAAAAGLLPTAYASLAGQVRLDSAPAPSTLRLALWLGTGLATAGLVLAVLLQSLPAGEAGALAFVTAALSLSGWAWSELRRSPRLATVSAAVPTEQASDSTPGKLPVARPETRAVQPPDEDPPWLQAARDSPTQARAAAGAARQQRREGAPTAVPHGTSGSGSSVVDPATANGRDSAGAAAVNQLTQEPAADHSRPGAAVPAPRPGASPRDRRQMPL